MQYFEVKHAMVCFDTDKQAVAVGFRPSEKKQIYDWSPPLKLRNWFPLNSLNDGLTLTDTMLVHWFILTHKYGIDPAVVHAAFLHVNEYQDLLRAACCGPNKGEVGHDPSYEYGTLRQNTPIIKTKRYSSFCIAWLSDGKFIPPFDKMSLMSKKPSRN